MKRMRVLAVVTLAVIVSGAPVGRANQGVEIVVTGAAAGVDIDIALNGPKVAQISVDPQGGGSSVLDFADMGKQRLQVYVERCEKGRKVRILIVVDGTTVPKDEDCDRTLAGWFWAHKARRLVVNVSASTLQVRSGMPAKAIAIAAAGGAAGVGLALAGGGSNAVSTPPVVTAPAAPNPPTSTNVVAAGSYQCVTNVKADPDSAAQFIRLAPSLVLTFAVTGATLNVTSPGETWVLTGTFDAATGRFNATGSINNITKRLEGTVDRNGALASDFIVTWPGCRPTTYGLTGQRMAS